MASIFKTTLKKDIIANIENDNQREIRFPITKFWATRLADEYDLSEKTFKFKSFNSLELSSPSNKDTISETYEFTYVRTYVDGDEFVVEFEDDVYETVEERVSDGVEIVEFEDVNAEETTEIEESIIENETLKIEDNDNEEVVDENVDSIDAETDCDINNDEEKIPTISYEDMFSIIKQWFDEKILKNLYDDEVVVATNARQVIILPKGKVLGSKKTLPVNNDVEVRVEFDMNKRVYFEPTLDLDFFADDIYKTLEEIYKNNFVFIWKRYTGIFMDTDGRIYFDIKYSTRKSIGFGRKYNVQ
jgi:hypothetical protein